MSVQQELLKKYGTPDADYQNRSCEVWDVQVDFPWATKIINTVTGIGWRRVMINKDFKVKLKAAFAELYANGLHTEIKTFDGCYEQRQVRGRNSTSLHAWAAAVDLNAATEKLAQNTTHWTDAFIAVIKKHGIFWGGDWNGRKDSMHFALMNG